MGKKFCSIGLYQKRAIDQQINMMENPVQSQLMAVNHIQLALKKFGQTKNI